MASSPTVYIGKRSREALTSGPVTALEAPDCESETVAAEATVAAESTAAPEPKSSPTPDHKPETAADKGVARNTALMSVATLGSRVTGLMRTWVMAFALGTTIISSAYQVANNMPNVIYSFVADGILGAAFVPVYLLQKERMKQAGGNLFANNILNLTVIILGVLSLIAAIFAPQVIATQTFTVADTAAVSKQAVFFFRIFAIQVLFYGISGVVNGILNAERIFFFPALAPALNNIVVIAAFLAYIPLSTTNPTLACIILAVGTTLGVAVQAFIQIPALKKTGFKYKLRIDLHDPALMEALRIAIPTFIYVIGSLVAYSCRNAFSLWTGESGPAVLAYAWMWFQLPYGVLAVSLSSTMFTEMSIDAAAENWASLRDHVRSGINITLVLIVPLAALMAVFSDSIMQLFQAGAFGEDDVKLVADMLRLWVIALPFYAVWMFLYKVFASMRKFMRFAVLNTVFVVFQCLLYLLLAPAGVLGLAGIAVADLVFYILGCIASLVMLFKMIGNLGITQMLWRFARILAASAVGVALAWALLHFLPLGGGGILTGLLQLVLYGSVSLVVIYAMCAVLKIPEMSFLTRLIKRFTKR